MAAPSQPPLSRLAGPLVFVLVVVLFAGAVLVRFVGDEVSPETAGAVGQATADSDASGAPREGRAAPKFTLAGPDGRAVSLSDWLGRPILINFWATWRGPCEVEMPAIQAVYEAHGEDGFVVLAVAVDDTPENVRGFFQKHGLTFQALMDNGTVSRSYQVFGLPTSIFVGSNGAITAVHTGLLTREMIEEYLEKDSTEKG